jgi:Putative addiction module component
MAIPALPLDEMTVEDKLQTIGASLSENPEAIELPASQEEELRMREARFASGEAKFIDWEEAKEEIRRQTS